MATDRPGNIEIPTRGEVSDRPQLHRGTDTQFSVTGGDTGTLSPTTKPVKAVKLVVYTMKEGQPFSESFSSGRLTTAQQILDKVLAQLSIPPSDHKVFGLWLKSKHLQLQLKPYHLPCKLYRRWKDLLSQYTCATYEDVCSDEPLLFVQRNAFLSLQEEKDLLEPHPADHRETIALLYHEAVHNITKNPYPIERDALHAMAGLQAAVDRAEHETKKEPILCQSNICQYYPSYMYTETRSTLFSSKGTAALKHTQQEFSKHMRSEYAACSDADQLKVAYLKKCWEHSVYGSVLFKGQIEKKHKTRHFLYYKDRQVYVAINMESIHILTASSPTEVLLHEPLKSICWEFQPCAVEGEDFFCSLLLEYEAFIVEGAEQKVFKILQLFSRQAPMMDAMLCRCVGHLDIDSQAREERPSVTDSIKPTLEHKLNCDKLSEDGKCLQLSLKRTGRKKSPSPAKSLSTAGEEHQMHELRKKPEGKETRI